VIKGLHCTCRHVYQTISLSLSLSLSFSVFACILYIVIYIIIYIYIRHILSYTYYMTYSPPPCHFHEWEYPGVFLVNGKEATRVLILHLHFPNRSPNHGFWPGRMIVPLEEWHFIVWLQKMTALLMRLSSPLSWCAIGNVILLHSLPWRILYQNRPSYVHVLLPSEQSVAGRWYQFTPYAITLSPKSSGAVRDLYLLQCH
jgi:hypothetical protein